MGRTSPLMQFSLAAVLVSACSTSCDGRCSAPTPAASGAHVPLPASSAPLPESSARADAGQTRSDPTCAAGKRTAITRGGRVVLCELDGTERRLATEVVEEDSASLSPDAERVAFTRVISAPDGGVDDGLEDADLRRVFVLDVASGEEHVVARRGACRISLAPWWIDDRTLLVHSWDRSWHSQAVCVIDVAARKQWAIARRTLCALPIPVGRYKGRFYVPGRDFVPQQGPVDSFGIVDRRGRRLRTFNADPFAMDYDGDGKDDGRDRLVCDFPEAWRAQIETIMRSW